MVVLVTKMSNVAQKRKSNGQGDSLPVVSHVALLQIDVAERYLACVASEGMGGSHVHLDVVVGRDCRHGCWKPLIPNIAGLEKIVLDELSESQCDVYNQIKSSFPDSNLEKVLSMIVD